MSEPTSALNRAEFKGIAKVEETGLHGMITLRGDQSSAAIKKAVLSVAGTVMPEQREAIFSDTGGVVWMSPDELMLLCPYSEVEARVAALNGALAGTHALAVNVSDARTVFRVSGPAARDVLSKLTPADLSPEVFGPGQVRRSRLAQVSAAFWMEDDETFGLFCFRSVAQYAFDLLKVAAAEGSEVGYF